MTTPHDEALRLARAYASGHYASGDTIHTTRAQHARNAETLARALIEANKRVEFITAQGNSAIRALQDQLAADRDILAAGNELAAEYRTDALVLRDDLGAAQTTVATLTAERDSLRAELAVWMTTAEAAAEITKQLEATIADLRAEVARLRGEIAKWERYRNSIDEALNSGNGSYKP